MDHGQAIEEIRSRGPKHAEKVEPKPARGLAARKAEAVNELVAAMPRNANKAAEYGLAAGQPPEGQHFDPPHPSAGSSTLSEGQTSLKTGTGKSHPGRNP